MPNPKRLLVTHYRAGAQDLFTVSADKRMARHATTRAQALGHTVLATLARFDFTITAWGLPLDAVLQPCRQALAAFQTATPPKARAPRQTTQPSSSAQPTAPRAPKSPKLPKGQAFATPPSTYRGVELIALSAIEDVMVVKLRDLTASNGGTIPPDIQTAYDKYLKLKTLALGNVSNSAMQAEADSALRMAIVNLVKLGF
jgi:hypothetical protein